MKIKFTESEKKEWKEVLDLIPKMQEAVKLGLNRHFGNRNPKQGINNGHGHIHNIERVKKELHLLNKGFQLFQGKYTLEIIYVLKGLHNPFFNQLKAALSNINPGTLSTRLKFLEKSGIILRTVHSSQPLRVSYSLTEIGEGFFNLLLPLIYYYLSEYNFDN
ncbi:MAG: winged helix-turn-helix transcriptional regulator [Promethearchaeota archaeon]